MESAYDRVIGMTKICKNCAFWNEGKEFSKMQFVTIKRRGIGFEKYHCSHIDDMVNDPGYETEGVETAHNFGCILFEDRS